ncbi:MAG: fumarylacetoacetate hydrolase family protein [Hyphomicrobiaceae bacterium]|nr:fumarylacetoacetate hydrolase family protein [Hyphomicrobiaceae bacterium]
MKFASFTTSDGRSDFGLVQSIHGEDDRVLPLGHHFGDLRSMLSLADWRSRFAAPDFGMDAGTLEMSRLRLAPVIPNPGKILGVGANYRSFLSHMKRETPQFPTIFIRLASSQIGGGEALQIPAVSESLDFEGELAVIIGSPARYLSEDNALDHVAGYACYNDATAVDWLKHSTQVTAAKAFPGTGAFGPVMVTADAFGDIGSKCLTTRLNGEVVQHSPLSDMVFGVASLVSYCSRFTLLEPGDVILTGTPVGAGITRDPKTWLKPGDRVDVEIEGIGTLSNQVVAERAV